MSCGSSARLPYVQRSQALHRLVAQQPQFATDGFDPTLTSWGFVNVLVVGAGGIGCEMLHMLALSGFEQMTVIDVDHIEVTNLNRQFLFREEDVGRPKSVVAAARVMQRCPGVQVHAVCGRVETQPDIFFQQFDLVLLALDSVEARLWVNRTVARLATWEVQPAPSSSSSPSTAADRPASRVYRITAAIPIIDTGTEGFQGHCRLLDMTNNKTPCVACEMYLYSARPPTVPMCTLANVPRTPEHCVLYAQFKLWPDAHGGRAVDGNSLEDIRWITEQARARQAAFRIAGEPIDESFAVGVVKHVMPAVGFTNAFVAGQAVTEALKWLTGAAPTLDNYALTNGATPLGVHSIARSLFGDAEASGGVCAVCGPRPVLELQPMMDPAAVRSAWAAASPAQAAIIADGTLRLQLPELGAEIMLSPSASRATVQTIAGRTLEEIVVKAAGETALQAWCASGALATVLCGPLQAQAVCCATEGKLPQ